MKLYSIYRFLSSPFFTIILLLTFILCVGFIIDYMISCIKKRTPHENFFDELLSSYDIPFKTRKTLLMLLDILLIVITIFSNNHFIIKLGCEDIRVMPDGTYCYYVLATNEKDKTYTLPANIEKIDGNYCIRNIYFKNGGYLYFDDCDYFEYDETARVCDQSGNFWNIKLTNNKTTHYKVNEVTHFSTYKLLEGFVMAFCFLIMVILNFIQLLKEEDKDY